MWEHIYLLSVSMVFINVTHRRKFETWKFFYLVVLTDYELKNVLSSRPYCYWVYCTHCFVSLLRSHHVVFDLQWKSTLSTNQVFQRSKYVQQQVIRYLTSCRFVKLVKTVKKNGDNTTLMSFTIVFLGQSNYIHPF